MSRLREIFSARTQHRVPQVNVEGITHIHGRWILAAQLIVATACALIAAFDIYPPGWWVVLIVVLMCAVTVARSYSPLMVYIAIAATAFTALAYDGSGISPLTMALTVSVVFLLRTNSLLLYSKPAMRFELAIIGQELLWATTISAALVLIALLVNLIGGAAGPASLAIAAVATTALITAIALGARSDEQPEHKNLETAAQ